jgi:hypothetical protein
VEHARVHPQRPRPGTYTPNNCVYMNMNKP